MIDTSDWKYFYKISPNGTLTSTNMMYTPLVNHDGTMMCMHWDENSLYLKDNSNVVTEDLINFFFEREAKNIQTFQHYAWAPTLHEIDYANRKIIIEWNSNTINRIFFDPNKDINVECPSWKEQLFQILQDLANEGYYKLALYPHCFYIKDGIIKTFDYYSCVGIKERYIARSNLEGMIGGDSTGRFNSATTSDGMVDFKIFFDITMNKQLDYTWIDNPFPEFYKQLKINDL